MHDIVANLCSFNNIYLIEKIKAKQMRIWWNMCALGACKSGNLETVKWAFSSGANDYNFSFYPACRSGSMDVINFLIDNGADSWGDGLEGACAGGHLEIAKMMLSKIVDQEVLNDTLGNACSREHQHIVGWLIQSGATRCNSCKRSPIEHLDRY